MKLLKNNNMKITDKIKSVLTSDIFIATASAVLGGVVFFKGLPLLGGVAIGVALTKLWGVLREDIKER